RSTVTATFTIANSSTPPVTPPPATPEPTAEPEATTPPVNQDGDANFSVVYSQQSNRSNPANLNGATVSGTIYPFATPAQGVTQVTFELNGSPGQVEANPPYDYNGGNQSTANAWNSSSVGD